MSQVKKAPGGAATFLRFAWQQLRNRKRLRQSFAAPFNSQAVRARLLALPQAPTVSCPAFAASDNDWRPAGIELRKGQHFTVIAHGVVWISKPFSVGAAPVTALWARIAGKGPPKKMRGDVSTFEAWADGALEMCLKPPGEWLDESGDFDPREPRAGAIGGVETVIAAWPGEPGRAILRALSLTESAHKPPPNGWSYFWRIGEGAIYGAAEDGGKPCIHVHTHGDVGILQFPVEAPLDDTTTLDWHWLVERLPSALPEHIQPTHDYLSIAVEFENGQDLTYFWSAGLPVDTVFKCPLPWWDKRETHWVLRSGRAGLGQWQSEHRNLKSDYAQAIGGTMPAKVVRIWLIANSAFQRQRGEAKFAGIELNASGVARRIV